METRTAKKKKVYFSKTTTLHMRHTFLYIFWPLLHDCNLISCALFMKYVDTTQKCSFSFSKPRYSVQSFLIQPKKISPTFDKLHEIE